MPINHLTAPDQYTTGSTLDVGRFLDHFNLDVLNQAIYWSVKTAGPRQTPGMSSWQPEVFMSPGSRTINRLNSSGLRFRAATPAASLPAGSLQAVVTLEEV